MMNDIINVGDHAFLGEIQAAVITTETPATQMINEAADPVDVGGYTIVPWGDDNLTPQNVLEKVEAAEVVEANLFFNICVGYGQGLKPMRKVYENGKIRYEELDPSDTKYKKVLDFFEDNDLEGYFLEQLTDMHTFFNVFPEIILDQKTGKKVITLRSIEATQSRWGSVKTGERRIMRHYTSAKWDDSPKKDDIIETPVLDRFNPAECLTELLKKSSKDRRFIYHINFPTPGRNYYQRPYWWAIFKSGWYDFLIQIPKIKKALLKNQLGLRYIIYTHPDYWTNLFKQENVDINDPKAVAAAKKKELQNINNFVAGEEQAGKGAVVMKNYRPAGNTVIEEKHLEIVELPRMVKEGELIADSEEASNIISYAMQVHSSLLGSTPGKSKGSFSGTDKRELFNIKASMMAPFISRIIRPLYFIKKYNKWADDVVFINPQIEFTTLDESSTGQTTKTEE